MVSLDSSTVESLSSITRQTFSQPVGYILHIVLEISYLVQLS